ncbi:MAG TPA: hypothetical protein VGB94_14740 [Acidobacteriaceae bacterium]
MHHLFIALSLTCMFMAPCFVSLDSQLEEQDCAPEQEASADRFHFTI